ncbi:MAG: endonuclease III [Acidobacteriota bacterium]
MPVKHGASKLSPNAPRPRTRDSHVSPHASNSIRYIIQNLKAVYGNPRPERELDPLDVLIETILSQSTSNANSGRAFESLKLRFPTWEQARRARVTSIEAAIRSGGLARQKSMRIKNLLNEIYRQRGSLDLFFLKSAPLDEAKQFLASFKGVGPKTVACTLLFACARPVFPIDTHIFRIARRLALIPERCSDEQAHEMMERIVPAERYFETHITLIRHGRKVCRPREPRCEECCLVDYCSYYHSEPRRGL